MTLNEYTAACCIGVGNVEVTFYGGLYGSDR